MAATISIKECNGAGPTATTITTSRLCTTDAYNPVLTYPLVVPSAGSNYSYVKSYYLNADTAPANGINNVKWYTAGSLGWTGVTVQVGTSASYTQATGTQGTTAAQMTGKTAQADSATFLVGAPLSVAGSIAAATGAITGSGTGGVFVVLQAVVGTTAVAGNLSAATLTWMYDET